MTVSISDNKVQYTGDGNQKVFPYTFRVLDSTHMIVTVDGYVNSNWTIDGIGDDGGGNVTMGVAPADGSEVLLYRAVPINQLIDYVPYDPFPAETHELGLDKLTMICQQLQEQLDRSLTFPPDSPDNDIILDIPSATDRPFKVLHFDSTGNVLKADYEIGNWQGEWQGGKRYTQRGFVVNNINSDLYVILQDHTSTDLDQDETDGKIVRIIKWTETNAWKWAQENEDVPVNDGQRTGFSAFHWAQKAEEYTSEALPRVRWLNTWQPIEYVFSDMVFEDGWLMIANKTTTDHAAPQPIGSLRWGYPEIPLFESPASTHAGTVYCGLKIDAASNANLITGVRMWLPDVAATVEYRLAVIDNNTGDYDVFQTFFGDVLASPGWYEASVNPFWINQGDDVSIAMIIQNVTAATSFNHPWTYKRVQGTTPSAGEVNRDATHSKVQIHKTDNDAVDQSTDLALVGVGSVLRMTDPLNVDSWLEYEVNTATDNGDYIELDVTYGAVGPNGEPAADTVLTCNFSQPTLGVATYPELLNFHTNGAATGILKLDDGAVVESDTGYGVDLLFQQYIFSPDWDIASYMGSGGSGSGGGGGGATVLVQEEKPDEATQKEGTLWFRSSTADMFCLYEDDDSKQWVKVACSIDKVDLSPEAQPQMYVGQYKNKIINGDFQVWQRGTSGSGSGYVSADRWRSNIADMTAERDISDATRPWHYHLKLTKTVSAFNIGVATTVELPFDGNAGPFIIGSTWTISYWARVTATADLRTIIRFADGAENLSPVDVMDESDTLPTINEWHKITHTFVVPSSPNSSNKAFRIYLGGVDFAVGDILYLADVQLEEGDQATAFERRHIQQELAMCQRYYWSKLHNTYELIDPGSGTGTPSVRTSRREHPVPMRTSTPTGIIIQAGNATFSPTDGSANVTNKPLTTLLVGQKNYRLDFSGGTNGVNYFVRSSSLPIEYAFDAEL